MQPIPEEKDARRTPPRRDLFDDQLLNSDDSIPWSVSPAASASSSPFQSPFVSGHTTPQQLRIRSRPPTPWQEGSQGEGSIDEMDVAYENEGLRPSVVTAQSNSNCAWEMSERGASMDLLPSEMIVSIFKYLALSELGTLARVCRKWREIAYSPYLNRVISVDVGDITCEELLAIRERRPSSVSFGSQSGVFVMRSILTNCADNIRRLDLSGAYHSVSNDVLCAISKHCVQLECLGVRWCANISDDGLRAVVEGCGNLRDIDLESCIKITDVGLLAIADNIGQRLNSLGIYACLRCTDRGVKAIALACPCLRFVNMSFCYLITDIGASFLADHCHDIECFRLAKRNGTYTTTLSTSPEAAHTTQLTQQEQPQPPQQQQQQQQRQLSMQQEQTDDLRPVMAPPVIGGMVAAARIGAYAQHHGALGRRAHMTPPARESDRLLLALARNCPRLRELDVTGSVGVSVAAACALADHCPELRLLDLSECFGVTDDVVLAIVQRCNRLEALHVNNCTRISPRSLFGLSEKCGGRIRQPVQRRTTQ